MKGKDKAFNIGDKVVTNAKAKKQYLGHSGEIGEITSMGKGKDRGLVMVVWNKFGNAESWSINLLSKISMDGSK